MYQNEIQMLRKFIDTVEIMEQFYEPPETIFHQFVSWISAVSNALKSPGLNQEYLAWEDHL